MEGGKEKKKKSSCAQLEKVSLYHKFKYEKNNDLPACLAVTDFHY